MEEVKGFENFKYNQFLELIDEKKKTEVFSRVEAVEIEESILLKEFAKNSKFEDIKVYTIVSSKEVEDENENYRVNSIIAKDRTRNFQKFDLNEAVNINKDAFEVASSEMNEEIESIKVSDYSVSTNETKTEMYEMTYEMCNMVKERFNNQVQTIKQLNHHFKKLDIKTEYKEIEPNQVQMRMKYNEEETKKEKEMEILFKKPKDSMSISDVILASILNSKSAKQYRDELFEKIKADLQKRTSLKVKYKENGKKVSREKFLFGNKNIIKEPFIREKKDL
jgi:hypothetical protein